MDSLDISIIRDTRTGKNAKVPKGVKFILNCIKNVFLGESEKDLSIYKYRST